MYLPDTIAIQNFWHEIMQKRKRMRLTTYKKEWLYLKIAAQRRSMKPIEKKKKTHFLSILFSTLLITTQLDKFYATLLIRAFCFFTFINHPIVGNSVGLEHGTQMKRGK